MFQIKLMMFDGAVQKGALEVSIKVQIGSVALSHIQIIVRIYLIIESIHF